jgi:hypothetical protein
MIGHNSAKIHENTLEHTYLSFMDHIYFAERSPVHGCSQIILKHKPPRKKRHVCPDFNMFNSIPIFHSESHEIRMFPWQ